MMTMSIRNRLIILLTSLLALACDRVLELPSIQLSKDNPLQFLVVNEGLFTTNTAALSAVYKDGTIYWDVFEPINQRPLGDVAQSITLINGKLFVAINNSRRIEVLDPNTFKSVASLRYSQSGSPRYITPLTNNTALVSDLYGQLVKISTTPPYEVLEYISLPTASSGIEQMATVRNKVFGVYLNRGIAILDAEKLWIPNMRLIDGLDIPWELGGCQLLVDHHQRVWCTSLLPNGVKLSAIDSQSETIVAEVVLSFDRSEPQEGNIIGMPKNNRVDIDPSGQYIYINLYIQPKEGQPLQTLFTIDVDSHKVSKYLELPGVKMMYGMNVSPDGDVFICDCLDYSAQRGYIRQFSKEGGEVRSYKVGVYPNRIFFPPKGGWQ